MAADIHQDGSVAIASAHLVARVKPLGAELCSLRDAGGREFVWGAGPAWPRHAPNLFPVIGRLHEDTLRLDGERFPMGQHGFARDFVFNLVEHRPDACRFLLEDSAATRLVYPFPFRLEIAYAIEAATLAIVFTVTNPGNAALPFCIGAHPAFAWPLPGAGGKDMHRLEFDAAEPGRVWRPDGNGLLVRSDGVLPLHDRVLPLHEGLFADGALVLLDPASRSVRFSAPGAPDLEVGWEGFGQLGIWMKPGADFLCIEPWAGHADLAGAATDFRRKPGVQELRVGERRHFAHRITLPG